MPSPASAASSQLPEPELERQLARAHGCPPGCVHCARADGAIGIPDRVQRFYEFITTEAALRMVTHCKRTGRSFPTISHDEVVQFLVEEACFERLHYAELMAQHATNAMQQGAGMEGLDLEAREDEEIADAISRAREYAASG